jgi:hypothetical protein
MEYWSDVFKVQYSNIPLLQRTIPFGYFFFLMPSESMIAAMRLLS